MKKEYASNDAVNQAIDAIVRYNNEPLLSVELMKDLGAAVETVGTLDTMIKTTPTHLLLGSADHAERRFQVGAKLVTYTGITKEGEPIQETWAGGVAPIKEDSVILTADVAIKYPEGHALEGKNVMGEYQADGKFIVDQDNGKDVLRNEYVSDVKFVKGAYGADATTEWQVGFKTDHAYVFKISEEVGDVAIMDPFQDNDVEMNITTGASVVMQTSKGKVIGVAGVAQADLERTYTDMAEYLASKAPAKE